MQQIHRQTLYKALSEPFFAKDVFSKLPIKEFTDDSKILAIVINRYYKTNDAPLDENTLLTLVEDRLIKENRPLEEQDRVTSVASSLYQLDFADTNEDTINETIQKYVRGTLTRVAIMDAVQKGAVSEETTINGLIDDLRDILTLDMDGSNGEIIDFFADVEFKKKALANLQQNKYPTGFFSIDSVIDGGLARGEVGLLNAETGGGKTSIAVNLARNYVRQGLNVLYVPLEEKVDRMLIRFEQLMSQVGKRQLLPDGEIDPALYDVIQEAYARAKSEDSNQPWGNLWIRKYKPQELTPNGFSQLISDVMIRKGQRVDIVILDYPDLMRNPHISSLGESEAGGKLYEDLRATAQEYDFVLWTLSQLNRGGYAQDVKRADSIEGSKRKMNAVEFVGTLNQKPEEFREGFLRIYLDKVRNNSGVAFDRMIYLKVEPATVTIRDETAEERYAHLELLNQDQSEGNDSYKKQNTHTPQQAKEKTDGINSQLLGVS